MPRTTSAIAPDWWDYTTLDAAILADAARLDAGRPVSPVAAGVPRRVLRHARGVLPRRSARIYHRVAAGHLRRAGRHLRSDRPDRAAAAGGAARERARPLARARALLGHGRVGGRTGARCRSRPSAVVREGRSRSVLQPHPAGAADAGRQPALPEGRHGRVPAAAGTPACAAR